MACGVINNFKQESGGCTIQKYILQIVSLLGVVFLISAAALATASEADDDPDVIKATIDGVTYSLNEKHKATVVGASADVESVTIPASVSYNNDSYDVERIDASVFSKKSKLKSVTIGASVDISGEFEGCTSLETVDLAGAVAIGKDAFSGCSSLKTVTLSSSISKIGTNSFFNCSALETIDLSNVEAIETNAFNGCISLKTVTFGDKLESIGSYAFDGCKALETIDLKSVRTINNYAFTKCTGLSSVNLGDSVTRIGAGAFYNSTLLTKITLPATATDVTFTPAVSSRVDTSAFPRTFTSLTIAEGNTKYYCEKDNVIVHEKESGIILFSSNIRGDLVVSNDVGDYAFYGQKITSLKIAEGVKSIGAFAFTNCKQLGAVELPSTLENHSNGFKGSSINTLKLNEGSKSVGGFSSCSNLKKVELPDSVETIKNQAFTSCDNLETINLPMNLKTIEKKAFYECTKLVLPSLPDSITEIETDAFYKVGGIEGFNLGKDHAVTLHPYSIDLRNANANGEFILNNVVCANELADNERAYGTLIYFASDCNVTLGEEFKLWKWQNGLGISIDGTTVYMKEPGYTGDIIIPKSVTKIKAAFHGFVLNDTDSWTLSCEDPSSEITLYASINKSKNDYGTFYSNKGLTSVSLPNVINLDYKAFGSCDNLVRFEVTSIDVVDAKMFERTKLSELHLPGCTTIKGTVGFENTLKLLDLSDSNLTSVAFKKFGSVILNQDRNKFAASNDSTLAKNINKKVFLREGMYLVEVASDNIVLVSKMADGNVEFSPHPKADGYFGLTATSGGSGADPRVFIVPEGSVPVTLQDSGKSAILAAKSGNVLSLETIREALGVPEISLYTDAGCKTPFVEGPVSEAVTLYAKIDLIYVQLQVDGKIAKTFDGKSPGDVVTLPSESRGGFVFDGWLLGGALLGPQYIVNADDIDLFGTIVLSASFSPVVKASWTLSVVGGSADKVFWTASNPIGGYGLITVLPGEFETVSFSTSSPGASVVRISDAVAMVFSRDGSDVGVDVAFGDIGKASGYEVSIIEIVRDGAPGFRAEVSADSGYVDTDGTFAVHYVYKVRNAATGLWNYSTSGQTSGVEDHVIAIGDDRRGSVTGEFVLGVEGAYLVYGYASYTYGDAAASGSATTATAVSPVVMSVSGIATVPSRP